MTARGFAMLSIAAALVLSGPVPAAGKGHAHGEEVTVQGEILDMACFVAHDGRGASHAECARKCLEGGQPMGLLAADGEVYLLFADHANAKAYNEAKSFAGKKVEVKGEPASKGVLKGITVHGVKPL